MHSPLNPSRTHATHAANNQREVRDDRLCDRTLRPKVLTLPISHHERAESRRGAVMSRLSASGPHRSSLWRRLRPRDNAAALLRGARAAALALACLAALALGVPGEAQAQTEVPDDWALKPADIDAGGQFRLMFVTSTNRDATSTDIADYNTFVRTRATAGVTAIQTYANDFTALVSTETVNARTNTLTRDTDTDAPIYWVRSGTVFASDRVADDYADFYDGSWNTFIGRTESGGLTGLLSPFWTGTNTDGTTHATEFMGATGISQISSIGLFLRNPPS